MALAGRVNMKQAPWPSWLSAVIVPLWFSTIFLQKPVPYRFLHTHL